MMSQLTQAELLFFVMFLVLASISHAVAVAVIASTFMAQQIKGIRTQKPVQDH